MIQDRYTVLFDPFATHAVQTIAAFASLHVGIMVTVCLMAELLHMKRWIAGRMWGFLALTVIATVYLGWHYFADTLGGAVLGAAGVWIAALGTGNHVRGRPRLKVREAEPAVERQRWPPSPGRGSPAVAGPARRTSPGRPIPNPAAATRSAIGRPRWQPPAARAAPAASRRCHRATPGSGESPCSTKCSRPPASAPGGPRPAPRRGPGWCTA